MTFSTGIAAVLLLTAPTLAQSTVRASVDSSGQQASGTSEGPDVSQDGRWVSFHSWAPDLVPGDGNGVADVFLRDDHKGTTERISVATGGTEANGDCTESSISGTGDRICFTSTATNLVTGFGPTAQIYVRDRVAVTTVAITVNSSSVPGNKPSFEADISLDGAWVTFISSATNLVMGDTNGADDIFLREISTGALTRVSVDSAGVQGNGPSEKPSVSVDGRYVAFVSAASNLVAGDTNGARDVFLHDTLTGATTRVSLDSAGLQAGGPSFNCALSPDAGFVAFASEASDLVPGDTNGVRDIFLRDLGAGTTVLASLSTAGVQGNANSYLPQVSWWGGCVGFHSEASNFAVNDTNGARDVFVRDPSTGETTRISRSPFGLSPNGTSWFPSLAANGRVVVYASFASNLVGGDTNGSQDVFLHTTTVPRWIALEGEVLEAAAGAGGDHLGACLSMSVSTIVAGADALGSGGPGAAHVFVAGGSAWSEQAVLTAGDATAGDAFGSAVGFSLNTAVVGAPSDDHAAGTDAGSAYAFARTGTTWTQQAQLFASNGAADDRFGSSVSLSVDTVLVGAPGADPSALADAGAAYVSLRSGTVWTEEAILVASNAAPGDAFGAAVSLGSNTAVVGAPGADPGGAVDAGCAVVFVRSGTIWTEQAILTASDAAPGAGFGTAVDYTGETLLVGAPADDPGGVLDAGSAYVFVRDGTTWTEEAKLTAADAAPGDALGSAVDVFAQTAVVGAASDDGAGLDAGSAYLFARSGVAWSEQVELVASDTGAGDAFGTAVALLGSRAVIGAPLDDRAAGADAGSARRFSFPLPAGANYCTAGTSASGCRALIYANGSPSATAASGFLVSAESVEGNKPALFFYGTNGRQANPWGDSSSRQCVVPPVKRGGQVPGSGTNGVCDGAYSQDLNAKWQAQPAHNPGAGAVMQAQLWYRDPLNTSNQTTSLSDAIQFVVGP